MYRKGNICISIICHWIKNLSISWLSLDNRVCNTLIFTYSSCFCSRGQINDWSADWSADCSHVILVKITIRFCQRNWKIPFRTSNVGEIGKSRKDEYMWSLLKFSNKKKISVAKTDAFLTKFWILIPKSFWIFFRIFEKQSFVFESSNIVTRWRKRFETDSISTSKIGNGFRCSFFFFCDSFNHFKFDLNTKSLFFCELGIKKLTVCVGAIKVLDE